MSMKMSEMTAKAFVALAFALFSARFEMSNGLNIQQRRGPKQRRLIHRAW